MKPKETIPCPYFPDPIKGTVVPQFEIPMEGSFKSHFRWWMWHPCYPYWSRSCWYGSSIEEAHQVLKDNGGENCYARLLVEERRGEVKADFKVVDSLPPEELSGWEPAHVEACMLANKVL